MSVAGVVPVFCYHGVGGPYPGTEQAFTFTAATFAAHLDRFVARGLRSITVDELVAARRAGDHAALASRVAITFDDGYADLLHTIAPLLAARGFTATAFVTTHHVAGRDEGRPDHERWLSTAELRDLDAAGPFEIGGHSHEHLPLDELAPDAARHQLTRCQAELTARLGHPVRSFAYPYGYSTPTVRRLVADAGFAQAVAVKHARSGPDDDPFDLARIRVMERHDLAQVEGFLDGRGVRLGPCPDELRTRIYRPVRRIRARLGALRTRAA